MSTSLRPVRSPPDTELSPELLLKIHSLMVKSRFLLSVVGNISREELTQKIKATIGNLPEGAFQAPPVQPPARLDV